jgi:hypothetical protein
MSAKDKDLKKAIESAEITDVDLESVSGGACNESCYEGCSQCCSTGTANRGGGGIEVDYQQ